jgi:cytochrome c553
MSPHPGLTVFVVALAVALPACAGGDPAAGAAKAKEACAACHGPDGNAPIAPDFPKLGGQHYDYLLHSLKAYKSGARKNAVMAGQVEKLSTRELENLAAYYAAQKSTLHVVPLHRLAGDL